MGKVIDMEEKRLGRASDRTMEIVTSLVHLLCCNTQAHNKIVLLVDGREFVVPAHNEHLLQSVEPDFTI